MITFVQCEGRHAWAWPQLMDLLSDEPTVGVHRVTGARSGQGPGRG